LPRRPKRFHELFGQTRSVSLIRDLCLGARQADEPVPHLLIVGPAGTGRRLLARAVAQEMGAAFTPLAAGHELTAARLAAAFADLDEHTVVFLDGIDRLPQQAQSLMSAVVGEGEVPGTDGKMFDGSDPTPLPSHLTILASTEAPGRITAALRTRFIRVTLDRYTAAEIKAIVGAIVSQQRSEFTPQAIRVVAEACGGSPRAAERLVHCIRLAVVGRRVSEEVARRELARLGLDEHGLWPQDRFYLVALSEAGDDGASTEVLALAARLDGLTLRREVEPVLMSRGLVYIKGATRHLTEEGASLAVTLRPAGASRGSEAAAVDEAEASSNEDVDAAS
jgi:Holliday junction resolvasome RuvABC ATP-dependent DNA helicase subunit